nr:VWA domain-containing protein [Ardenticatena sp.]
MRGTKIFRSLHREAGQSLVIIGGALVALMALLALVTDAGNAYVQRQRVQNAVDAATLAGGAELARVAVDPNSGRYAGTVQDERRIWQTIIRVAQANGIPDSNGNPNDDINTNIEAYFIGPGGERVGVPLPNNGGIPPSYEVSGIEVRSTLDFQTFFARVIGFDEMETSADAFAQANPNWCPASASNLFPIAVSAALFQDDPGGKPIEGATYRIWEKGNNSSYGNFGWVSWNNDPSNTTLVSNMHDTRRSGTWRVGDMLPGATGVMKSRSVRNELDAYISGATHSHDGVTIQHDPSVVVPIYDYTTGRGNNLRYHIVGFARFRLTDYKARGRNKWIEGVFERYVDTTAPPGGGCYLTQTVKLYDEPPADLGRVIAGTVHLNEIFYTEGTTEQKIPVDVMLVLDISGSMRASWSGGSSKLQSAKDALITFNNTLNTVEGDRVGLTTFPTVSSGSQYRTVCDNYRLRTRLYSEVRSPLTDNVAYVNSIIRSLNANSATSLAHAIQTAREQLLADLRPGAVPVLIIASDGIVNVTLDGKWTGFGGAAGQGQNTPACNNQAEQQTIDQANLAKEAGIIVFSIAIGDGFNTAVTEAIASPDVDYDGNGRIDDYERHFYVARNASDLANIYQLIGNRVQQIGKEGTYYTKETLGAGATIELRTTSGAVVQTTTANNAGAYQFTDVAPGTYRLTARVNRNGLVYDILTYGNGGPPRNPDNPRGGYVEVSVGQGTGVTQVEVLYLSTCDGAARPTWCP